MPNDRQKPEEDIVGIGREREMEDGEEKGGSKLISEGYRMSVCLSVCLLLSLLMWFSVQSILTAFLTSLPNVCGERETVESNREWALAPPGGLGGVRWC